jgi:drug/metabolite transporter (DMT)-like permease
MSDNSSSSVTPNVRLGIILMLLSMLMFALNDTMGKWLVSTYTVGQLVLIRSLAALVVLSPLFWKTGSKKLFLVERPGLHLLRAFLFAFEACAFYFAVIYMPLADAMTYWLAAPIYVAAVSPLFLGEKVGWRRWTAIILGFVGVIVALEPSAQTFSLPALLSLAGSLAFAMAMVLGRSLRAASDATLVFWQAAGAVVIAGLMLLFGVSEWVPVGPLDLSFLCMLGVVSMLAHLLVNRSLKLADTSTVVPLQYTLLIWGIIFGWIIFDDRPRFAMLVGALIIVASGLFIFFREQKLRRDGKL